MNRPNYLSKYLFDWELTDVVISGKSALDSRFFVGTMYDEEQVNSFLKGYGLDPSDPVNKAELFGNFQESLQFVKRYFLKEGNPEGLDIKIPSSLYMITEIGDLFMMATGDQENSETTEEERLWAEVILKVMHTILHVDKDLRSNYFNVIQTQIFDRFYRHVYREDEKLYLSDCESSENSIPLSSFETKSKKSRDSVIIKLLHKPENVAEELFDRIGIRIVTKTRLDVLRVLKYLLEKNIIIPHNIKPSRSVNTMIDLEKFKRLHNQALKRALRENLSEDEFLKELENLAEESFFEGRNPRNKFSLEDYQSIQFTCRQLVRYKNPFIQDFNELRKLAKKKQGDELAEKVLALDTSLIARDVRFFYPYEVQIVDERAYKINTEGEASHVEYKKQQIRSAMKRVFRGLIDLKNLDLEQT